MVIQEWLNEKRKDEIVISQCGKIITDAQELKESKNIILYRKMNGGMMNTVEGLAFNLNELMNTVLAIGEAWGEMKVDKIGRVIYGGDTKIKWTLTVAVRQLNEMENLKRNGHLNA